MVTISSLRFIQRICSSNLPISDSSFQSYISRIELALHKGDETVQQAASEALGSLSTRYNVAPLLPKWANHLKSKSNFVLRRGWAAALGYVYLSEYNFVLELLCHTLENETDVETKRNAAKSVGRIFERVTDVEGTSRFISC
jgi:hypothetical protein